MVSISVNIRMTSQADSSSIVSLHDIVHSSGGCDAQAVVPLAYHAGC